MTGWKSFTPVYKIYACSKQTVKITKNRCNEWKIERMTLYDVVGARCSRSAVIFNHADVNKCFDRFCSGCESG